jgi:hypothetical protein
VSRSTPEEESYEVRIVSAIPGRLRFKIPAERRTEESLRRLGNAFAGLEGAEVETNPQTGSMLLRYDAERLNVAEIERALADLDITPVFERQSRAGGAGPPAGRVKSIAEGLNSRVAGKTRGVDLRLLVPLGLGALSVRQAVREAPGLKHAPWYVLAWYAFDSFIKLNGEPRTSMAVGIPDRLAVQTDTEGLKPADESREV